MGETAFNLLLSSDYKKGEILSVWKSIEVIVLKAPKKRDTWYWKVLRFLTFGLLFKPNYYHRVKIVE